MRARELLPAALVVLCAILGGLWPVDERPVTPSDGPQFLEWLEEHPELSIP